MPDSEFLQARTSCRVSRPSLRVVVLRVGRARPCSTYGDRRPACGTGVRMPSRGSRRSPFTNAHCNALEGPAVVRISTPTPPRSHKGGGPHQCARTASVLHCWTCRWKVSCKRFDVGLPGQLTGQWVATSEGWRWRLLQGGLRGFIPSVKTLALPRLPSRSRHPDDGPIHFRGCLGEPEQRSPSSPPRIPDGISLFGGRPPRRAKF
jgi:hypothetical protein